MALTERDPSTYIPAEQALAEHMSQHLVTARDAMAEQMEEKRQAWLESDENKLLSSGMTRLFGSDVPYADFMGEAAGDFVAESIAGVAGAVVGGGFAVGGTATAMISATGVILPHVFGSAVTLKLAAGAGTAASTQSIAAGSSMVSGFSATGAVAGPGAIVLAGVVVGITRGVQVFENDEQRQLYEGWQDSKGTELLISDLQLTDEEGEQNPVDRAILLGAIASMLGT